MITAYDKALVALGSLAVAICAAAGVDTSGLVQSLVGVGLILIPVLVYYVRNKGISYKVTSKALAALPAAVVGVFVALHISVSPELQQIGKQLLALVPFLVMSVGNSGALNPDEVTDSTIQPDVGQGEVQG